MNYIRYANSFIIGTICNKFAYKVLSHISLILENYGITLDITKTYVKHYKEGVSFLGYHIYGNY